MHGIAPPARQAIVNASKRIDRGLEFDYEIECRSVASLNKETKDVRKRMFRFIETGISKRLAKLRGRLAKLQFDLGMLREIEAAWARSRFRKSYAFEAWCEETFL